MWSNKMNDLDADEEWSDDDYAKAKSYTEKDRSEAGQSGGTTSKQPQAAQTLPSDIDPISIILSKIDAELATMKDRDAKITARHNNLDTRYQAVPQQASLPGYHQREQAVLHSSETDHRSSMLKFVESSNEKQQELFEPHEYTEAAPSDDEREHKSNPGTPKDLDPLSAQEIDKKFKEIMLKKKGETTNALTARINSWNATRPSTTMLSTGYGTDSESVRTEDFEAKFMGMMVPPSEGDGRLANPGNTKTVPEILGRLTTDTEPRRQGLEFKPKSIITTRPRSLSPRRTSISGHGKPGRLHQVNDSSPQQSHRRNNQLFSWDDVFWKDASKKGPLSVTSTTSTFEEVESLCLSKRSSDSMGSSQRQWNRVTGSGQSGLSRNGVSPSRRLASRQSSLTSSSTSSVLSYDSPSTNVPAGQSQRFTDELLQSLEFINSRGNLDLAEKIFLENLLQRVLDNDVKIPKPTETSSSSSLNQFFQKQNQPYQSPSLRTLTTNPYHSQSVLSSKLENEVYLQKSNEQKYSNAETSTHQSKANIESKRRGDLILSDDDNTSGESNKHSRSNKSKHDTQNRRISNSSNDETASSKLLSTDSKSKTSVSSTGMDSGFPKEGTQFSSLSQQAYNPNLATYLPANSFVQRGSFERTVTPPDPYVFNQPYTTSHAERVLMGLGFSSTEGFLPERFLRDWYDKISKAQMAAMAEMKERESFDNLLENISRSVSRKPSLSNINDDFAGGHYSQANVHQSSDSPAHEEQATVTLPSSSENSRLERLNEYVASFYKSSFPGDDVKGRRTKQFASSRQNSLPLFLEAFSEVDNGRKSRKPRVDPHDMEARLEIFLAELLASKKIHASDSGSDSFSSLSERQINNNDLYSSQYRQINNNDLYSSQYRQINNNDLYSSQYSSVNKKEDTQHTRKTRRYGSPRHNRNQNNDKYGGYEEINIESTDRSYPKNKDNSNTSPRAYSQNQKVRPFRQSAVDNSFIVSHQRETSRLSINEEPNPFDNTTSSKRSEYNQRKHIVGRSQKRPNKTESVQSIDGLEVADIMQNQTNEDNENKEDLEGGHFTTRNPALKLVEPAMVSIVLEDVDQDPAESSFDFPSGSFERTLLGIPSSRRSSTSLSPIPQSPVTVIEVSLDNQQDSLDTEGTGSSKDTDEDNSCVNSTDAPLDEPKAQQSRFSRKGSLSPKAERLKRSRCGNVTVNKEIMVTNDSIDSAGGPPQRRLSLEVPLVPELRQAIDRHKMRKIHDLNESSEEHIMEETRSTLRSRTPLRDADKTRLDLAHIDSAQTKNHQPIQYTSNNQRNGIADNNTANNLCTNSLELPEFSEDGCDYGCNITKPRSGYVQQYVKQIGDCNATGDNTPTSLGMHNNVSEFKIGFPGSKESTPESFKSAFRDARRNHKELSPGSSTGFCSDTDEIKISQRKENLTQKLMTRKMISENDTSSNIDNSNAISNFSPSYDQHSAVGVSNPWQFKRTEGQMPRKLNDSPSYYQATDELKYPPDFDSSVYYFACDRESQCDLSNWISEIECNIGVNHSDKFTQTGIPKFEISSQTTETIAYTDTPDEQVDSVQRHARTKAVNTVLCLMGKEHDIEMDIVNLPEEVFSERMISNLSIVDETLQLIDAELLSIRKREIERLTYLPSVDSENQIFHCGKPNCISCVTERNTDEKHEGFLLKRNARLRKTDLGNECRKRVYAPSSWDDATVGASTYRLVESSNVVESNQRLFVQQNACGLKGTQFQVPYAEYKFTHDLSEISNNVSMSFPTNHLQERNGSRAHVLSFNSGDENNERSDNNGCSSRNYQKRRRQKRKEKRVNNQGTHHKLGLMSSTENMFTDAGVIEIKKSVTSDSSNCDTEENMHVNWLTPLSITCSKRTSSLASDGSNEEADDLLRKEHSVVTGSPVNSSPAQDAQHKVLHPIQRDGSHAKLSRLRYQSSHRTSSSSFEIESDFMTASQFGIIPTNTLQNRHRDMPGVQPAGYSLGHSADVQEESLLCSDTANIASHISNNIAVNPIWSSDHEEKYVHYEDVTERLSAQETHLNDVETLNEDTLKEFTTTNLKEDTHDLLNRLSDKTDHTTLDSAQSCKQINTSMVLARIAIPEIVISRTDSSDSLHVPRSPDHHLQKATLPSSSGSSSSSMSCSVLPYKASKQNCDDAKADAVDTLCPKESVTNNIMEYEETDANSHKHMKGIKDVTMAEIRLAYLTDSEKAASAFETYTDGRHLNGIECTHFGFRDRNVQSSCSNQPDFGAHSDSILGFEFNDALCQDSVNSSACGNVELNQYTNQAMFELDFLTLGQQFRSTCSSGRSFPHSLDASTNKSIAGSDCSQDVDDMDVLIEESRHMRHSSSSSYSEPVLDISDSLSDASMSSVGSRRVISEKPECQICKSNANLDHDSESEELSPARGRSIAEPSYVYPFMPLSAVSGKETARDYAIPNNFRSSSKETSEETKRSKHKLNETIPAEMLNGVTDIHNEATEEVANDPQDKYEVMLSVLQRQSQDNHNGASNGSEVCLKDTQHSGESIYKHKSSNKYIKDNGSEHAVHGDCFYGTPLEMNSSKDNSSRLKVESDNEDKEDMHCVPTTLVWRSDYTQDKSYPLDANSVSKVSSPTVSESDSRHSINKGTSDTNGMLKTVPSNMENALKTGVLTMRRELKSCVETGINTNHDIQTEINNSRSEHFRHVDPRTDMAARQAYLRRHYPSIAPDQPKADMTSANENNADSDTPPYQYWQASSESSSITFPLSEISEGETSDEDSTNEVNKNEIFQHPSVSRSLTNTCFEDDSNAEKPSLTLTSLEVSGKTSILKQVPIDSPYSKQPDVSCDNGSESIRSETAFGVPDLQTTISSPGLLSLSVNNSNIVLSNARFDNMPQDDICNGTKDYTSPDTIAESAHAHEEIQHTLDISVAMDFTLDKYHSRNSAHETRTLETQYDVFGNITHKTTDSYIRRRTYYNSPYLYPRELIADNVSENKLDNKSYVSSAELSIGDYRKHNETLPDSCLTNLRPVDIDAATNHQESPVNNTPPGNTIPEKLVANHSFKTRKLIKYGHNQTSAYNNIQDENIISYHVDEGIDNKSRNDDYVVVPDSSNPMFGTADIPERCDDKGEDPCHIIRNIVDDETICNDYKLENVSFGDKWGNYVSSNTGIFNIGSLDTSLRGVWSGDFHNSFEGNNGVSSNEHSDNYIRGNSNGDLRKSCTNVHVASTNGDKDKRRQNLREKLLKMFTRDIPKEVELNNDNTIECVGNSMVDTDICEELASYVPRNVSTVPQTIRTMSPTVSSMSGTDTSKDIEHLKQEARLKYLLGECVDGFDVATHASVSDESVTTSQPPTVVSETDYFGATTKRNAATDGIQSNIYSQDSQYTIIGSFDPCTSKVEILPGNNTLDERMTLMLDSGNGHVFEEIYSSAETIKKQSYDSTVIRNVKVTTIFSNSDGSIPKSVLISDPSSCVGESQNVLTQGGDSSVYHKSLTKSCEPEEHGVSSSADAVARNSMSKRNSLDSLLSLHQHIKVSSSTGSNDEDMDIVSALTSCGDYDIRIMDMALGRCISLDSDEDRPRAIEDYAGKRLSSQAGTTAQVTSIDNAVANYRAGNNSPASVEISDFSNLNKENVTRAEYSTDHTALFTDTNEENEDLRGHTNDNGLDVSLHDPFRRFSFDMMSLEHHTTNAEFGTEISSKRDSRRETSETRSEPGDYKQFADKPYERHLRLSPLGRAKTGARFLSPSSAERQTTREISKQPIESGIKSFDASHPELTYLDFLPHLSQKRNIINVPSRRRQNIEIVLSSPEATNSELAISGATEDRLTNQGSSVKYELCNQHMVLKHTRLHQGGEIPHLITENDGVSTSGNINVHPRKSKHPACQELHFLDIHGTKSSLISQGLDDVTATQELDSLATQCQDDVTVQDLDSLAPECQDDVTAHELDSFLPECLNDVTAQELDALIPQEFDEVTSQELDDLIAQVNNNVSLRKLQPEFHKHIHIQFSQEEQDSSRLHFITNQDATVQPGNNITHSHTSYDIGHLDQLPASLEDLHHSENVTWSELSYMKSLSVTSRDSGFDSHGSPVDVAYKVQEHKYSTFTDATLELSF